MYVQKRKDRDGDVYFSFVYTDENGKRVRLKKDEHPHFKTLDAAEEWARSQTGVLASRKAQIARKTAWRTQFYKFDELLDTWLRDAEADRSADEVSRSYGPSWKWPAFEARKALSKAWRPPAACATWIRPRLDSGGRRNPVP